MYGITKAVYGFSPMDSVLYRWAPLFYLMIQSDEEEKTNKSTD